MLPTYKGYLPTYKGYTILAVWVTDHWVYKVYLGDAWMDSFLSIDDVKPAIDSWED